MPARFDDFDDVPSLSEEEGVLTEHKRLRVTSQHRGERRVDAVPLGRIVHFDLHTKLLSRETQVFYESRVGGITWV